MAKFDNTTQALSTVQAIYRVYEFTTRTQQPRPHLGASQIGHPCARYIWYQFRWCAPSNTGFDGRMLRLFATGNIEESRLIDDLKRAGITVSGTQDHYRDHENTFFSGSVDGIGTGFPDDPDIRHIIELKSMNDANFKKLVSSGVRIAKPQHYVQMQMYLYWSGCVYAEYFAVNKNTDDIYGETVKLDIDCVIQTREKAKQITCSIDPPEKLTANPDDFRCRYCEYRGMCHGSDIPEVNCRTCAHVTPDLDTGKFVCGLTGHTMSPVFETGIRPCQNHIFIPSLIPYPVVCADGLPEPYVSYMVGKEVVTNGGKDGYDSGNFRDVVTGFRYCKGANE